MMNINSIVTKNIELFRKFFTDNFNVRLSSNIMKLSVNCPYCHTKDTKYHLVLNLDWGIAKCFRCGTSTSILSFLKKEGLSKEYYDLLQSVSDFSLYELQSLIKKDYVRTKKTTNENYDFSNKFIKENNLVPAEKIEEAAKYALARTRKNSNEVSTYYADNNYIYVPIFRNHKIVSFIARRYNNNAMVPRYKIIKLTQNEPIAFLDEIEENISSNILYITEGYFDSFAINSSFGEFCSIAILSKTGTNTFIEELKEIIPEETNIVIVLDSPNKDRDIFYSIDKLLQKLQENFQNISICLLKEEDPNYIFEKYGKTELINQLKECTINASAYIKKRLLNKKINNTEDDYDTIKLPSSLLRVKRRIDRNDN